MHEVGPGGFVAQAFDPVESGCGDVKQGSAGLFRNLFHRGGIIAVAVAVEPAILEPAAGDRSEQHGISSLLPHAVDERAEIVLVGTPGSCISRGIGFLGVVVPELDKYVIAGLYRVVYLVPEAPVDETLCAAAVLGVVYHFDPVVEEILEHHAPAALGIAFGKVFLRHGAVTHEVDGE